MPSPDSSQSDGVRSDMLTADQKRAVWAHIRHNDPDLLAFLTSPEMAAIRDRLNKQFPGSCVPVIPWRTLRAALPIEDVRHIHASSNLNARSQ